jgi:hypothetical protein
LAILGFSFEKISHIKSSVYSSLDKVNAKDEVNTQQIPTKKSIETRRLSKTSFRQNAALLVDFFMNSFFLKHTHFLLFLRHKLSFFKLTSFVILFSRWSVQLKIKFYLSETSFKKFLLHFTLYTNNRIETFELWVIEKIYNRNENVHVFLRHQLVIIVVFG